MKISDDDFPIEVLHYTHCGLVFGAKLKQDLPSLSADSAVPGLNRNLAYMNRVLVPAIAPINSHDEYAKTLFAQRNLLQEESRALATLQDTLLPRLVSGELRTDRWNVKRELIEF